MDSARLSCQKISLYLAAMKKFTVTQVTDPESSYFDRQERIEWWDQEKLQNAKVMVMGAGAIGNETLKNLALLGVGNIFIADFDEISTSNLSRTVLFRRGDEGKRKAEVAAARTKELALSKDVRIDWFHGDVVWEFGTGMFEEMDLVLGCLDNVETRIALGKQCKMAGTPWIDSGIFELGLRVNFYHPDKVPCYYCGTSPDQRIAARQRYSCDDFKKQVFAEGKIPTTQIASTLVSGLQVQEAVKFLCGQPIAEGRQIYFQGKINDFDTFEMPVLPECKEAGDCCYIGTYPEVRDLSLSSQVSLREFLEEVSKPENSGEGATLDFRGDRTFVKSVISRCPRKVKIEMMRPSFRIYDYETVSEEYRDGEGVVDELQESMQQETVKETLEQFSLETTEKAVLDLSLRDIGVPFLHILAVQKGEDYHYYRLSGDKTVIFPEISR